MKTLLLLTHAYPYDAGEDFLSAELEQAFGFDRVIVCPCSLEQNSVQTKSLAPEVQCIPVRRKPLGRAAYLLQLFRPCVMGEIFRLLFSGRFQAARVHELLYFMKNATEIYHGLKQNLLAVQEDSVTIYSYWLYDAAAAGVMLAADLRKKGVAVRQITRAHGFDIHSERSKHGYLPMRTWLFRHIDRIFPCSDDGAAVLKKEAGKEAGKITRAYLGTRSCSIGKPERLPLHIVSCSYMVPVKRLNLIAEALQQADFPIAWTHIGSGPLRQELLAAAEKMPPNVTVEFAGQKKNDDVLEYYKNTPVSAFVNVSSSEGIPVTIMEAFSFGIPVIATDVGGTHEIVADGQNGFLLPKDFKPQQLLSLLRRICKMEEEDYRMLCSSARAAWEQNFNAAENYRRFYSELIS